VQTAAREHADARSFGRNVEIDILRGYAIIGVVLFHLWEDIRQTGYGAGWFYLRFAERLRAGEWSRLPTSALDAFLSAEYRVPMFMMLSGLSLYLAAARKGGPIERLTFYRRRIRSLLVPYWFAVVLVFAVIGLIALLQYGLHGHSLGYQYHHVTEARTNYVARGPGQFLIALTLIPRLFHSGWEWAPPYVMWFVVLHVQYYLAFPFLYVFLNRIKPLNFLVFAFVATAAAKLVLIATLGGINNDPGRHINHAFALFRWFEFALGMSLGYFMIHDLDRLRDRIMRPRTIVALALVGALFAVGGNLMDDGSEYYSAVAAPIVIAGIALIVLPIVAKKPGRVEGTPPLRLLAWMGPISYAILIANEPLRLVASFLRVEEIPNATWWLFLVAYVPLTLLIARRLASFLGIGRRAQPAAGPPDEGSDRTAPALRIGATAHGIPEPAGVR
jgi:peptidoglycan/LPS O-acetylase OafA/YrhL